MILTSRSNALDTSTECLIPHFHIAVGFTFFICRTLFGRLGTLMLYQNHPTAEGWVFCRTPCVEKISPLDKELDNLEEWLGVSLIECVSCSHYRGIKPVIPCLNRFISLLTSQTWMGSSEPPASEFRSLPHSWLL